MAQVALVPVFREAVRFRVQAPALHLPPCVMVEHAGMILSGKDKVHEVGLHIQGRRGEQFFQDGLLAVPWRKVVEDSKRIDVSAVCLDFRIRREPPAQRHVVLARLAVPVEPCALIP